MIQSLPTDKIDRRADARAVNEATVATLMDSIAEVGLINPIRVRAAGDRWEAIAGAHRLAACQRLGLADIECVVVADDDLHAELAMIDENLCRAELSPAERSSQTARRKAIYEELHPETRHGANQHSRSGEVCHSTFADATASATGRSARAVRQDAERGAKVIQEVLDMIQGTPLDTGAYLDKLKRLPANEQYTVAKRDLAEASRPARKPQSSPRPSRIDADVKARAAKEVAEVLAAHVPHDAWDGMKANLYAAGARNIADELANITGQSIMDRRYA